MLIATFGPTTAWLGKTITYEQGRFEVEGVATVSAQDVLSYDQQGHLQWAYDGLREWVGEVAAATSPPGITNSAVTAATTTGRTNWSGEVQEPNGPPVLRWYFWALKKYVGFGGRARRREYWSFTLVNTLIVFGLMMADAALGTSDVSQGGSVWGLLSGFYFLAMFLPLLAVTVRRLHDTNRSGWWVLLQLVPFGGLVILVFLCMDSNPTFNSYGPYPKPGIGLMKPL